MNRRVLAVSFGFSFAVVVSIVLALALSEGEASATAYTASFGPGNWSNPSTWFPSGIPGSGVGDTASVLSAVTMDYSIGSGNELAGLSISGGPLTMGATGQLRLGTGSFNVNSGSFVMTTGSLFLTSGSAFSVASGAVFTWTGGSINGTGDVTNNGTSFTCCGSWNSTGILTNNGTVSQNPAGGFGLNAGTVDNFGIWNWSAGNTTIAGSAIFNNYNGAALNITNNGDMNGPGTFKNISGGAVTKSGGGGNTRFFTGIVLKNDGVLTSNSGTIQFSVSASGSDSNGTFNANTGGLEFFGGGVLNLLATSSVSGAGGITVSAGTVNVGGSFSSTGPTTISGGTANFNGATPAVLTNLNLSGGTLGGTGAVTLNGTTTVGNPTIAGTGTKTIPLTGIMNITGSPTIKQATIDNNGTINWSAPGGMDIGQSAIINNKSTATFDITTDQAVTIFVGGPAPTWNNDGTFRKSAGAVISSIGVGTFNHNAGLLQALSGTLSLSGGGSISAQVNASLNAAVNLNGGTFLGHLGATFTGAGLSGITGGTLTIDPGVTVTASNFKSPGGTLNGSGNFTLLTGGVWNDASATIAGTGLRTIQSGATMNITSGSAINGGTTIEDQGTVTITGSSALDVGGGATIHVAAGGLWDIQNDQPVFIFSGAPAPTWQIDGTLRKSVATGVTGSLGVGSLTASSASTISVQSGTLQMPSGTLTINGSVTTGPGGTLEFIFGSNPTTLSATSTVGGSGTIKFSGANATVTSATYNPSGTTLVTGGTVAINGSYSPTGPTTITGGTVVFNGSYSPAGQTTITGGTATFNTPSPASAPTVTLSGGTLNGTSILNIGNLTWPAGLMSGTGTTNVSTSVAMTNTGIATLDTRTFNNNGTFTYTPSGSGWLNLASGAVFNNAGTFNATTFGAIGSAGASGVFNNTGTFTKNGSSSLLIALGIAFHNIGPSGTVNINSGNLELSDTANTSNGTINLGASPNYLYVNGVLTISGGSVTSSGGRVAINGGTLNISVTPFSIPELDIYVGTLNNSAALTIATLVWQGGTITGSGSVTVTNGIGSFLTANATLNGHTINNQFPWSYQPGSFALNLINGAVINNSGGFLFDNGLLDSTSGGATINNTSGFQKNSGTGTSTVAAGITFVNTSPGGVFANSGTLVFAGPFTQNSGRIEMNGGNLAFSMPLVLNGGSLRGTGTVTGDVTNAAIVEPGLSPGMINIVGNYTQTAAGTLNIELAGTTAGTQYDQLNVSNAVTLGGTLNITYLSFTPSPGDTFTVLSFGSRPGSTDFATKNGLTYSGGSLNPTYTPTSLQLVAIASPMTDLVITKSAPATVSNGQNMTYTIVVTNNGPDAATGVTMMDTLPAGVSFVSSSSTVGSCSGTTTVTCTIGSLINGATATITIVVKANVPPTVTNTATVAGNEIDPNSGNNSASATTTISPNADMKIAKLDSPDPVPAGSPIAYTLNVNNAGPDVASGIVVTDTLPSGVTFVSAFGTNWSCSNSAGTVTCNFSTTLAPSTSAPPITINVLAPASAGLINNTASVTSSLADSNLANNTASASTTVTAAADLSITKTGPPTVTAGQNVSYTITVTNNGPSNVSNATVGDVPGAGLTFVSNTGACTTTFPCTIATLNAGQTVTFTSTWSVSPAATGSVSNTANVSAAGVTDSIPANNSSTAISSVVQSADLSITKSGPASAAPGTTITYTVTVTNNGPSNASSVIVDDTPGAGLTFQSNSGACSSAYPCSFASMTAGQSVTISSTYTISAAATGSVSNTATVSSGTPDPAPANNSATANTTLVPSADVAIAKTGPPTLPSSGSVTFTITVKNFGPSSATNVMVNDTPTRLTFVSNSGGCTTPFPCNLGNLAPSQIVTITSTFNVVPNSTSASNTATVSSSTSDANSSNNSSTVALGTSCPTAAPAIISPAPGQTGVPLAGTIQWNGNGSTRYDVSLGPAASNGCSNFVATVAGTSYSYSGLSPNTDYEVSVVGTKPGCPATASQCIRFRTGASPCNLTAPTDLKPANGSTTTSPVTFSWTGNGETYHLVAAVNGINAVDVTTPATSFTANLNNGTVTWSVTALAKNCTEGVTSTGTFTVCSPPVAPLAGVVGAPSSGRSYAVTVVDPSPNNVLYEFQEADNDSFNNPLTQTTSTPSVSYTHTATTSAVVFFYRVRAFSACTNTPGLFSKTIRVVIVPITVNLKRPTVNVPAGSKDLVVQQVSIPGESAPIAFTATADRPWIVKIDPSSGILPIDGITLNVTIDPALLPNGTFTATVLISFPSLATNGRIAPNGTTGKSAPITINLVTPVVPTDRDAPTAESLIIPAVGHLVGLNSQWRSDIRVYNASPQKLKYLLNFVAQGSSEVKRTTIETEVGATTALDDVIHNWYGFGEVGDSATGVLEIRPLPPDSAPNSALSTIVSSRTYNQSGDGRLGQFIPGVQFKSFIGSGSRLSMQQLAQTSTYRSNFGVVEASGASASVLLTMFNSAGTRLFDLPLTLAGGEQKLLNGLLASQGVSLSDGRMEVRVTGGDGKVTAYASVIDSNSIDPLFVPGQPIGDTNARTYVVPGVADLNNPSANWQTDMRIFNSGATPQTVNLTFYQANNAAAPKAATVTVNPNEVKVLDSVLASVFSATNVGGAVHADTATDSQLVITARTYNQTANGSLGQFIAAPTLAEGVDRAGRALNILQVEDSPRDRTNIGLAEMSGKPATVEISVTLPDSKVTPSIQVPLGANEFRQFGVAEFGLGNIYNARVSVKVIDGDGRITAYGSVIDQVTTAPTYIKAQ